MNTKFNQKTVVQVEKNEQPIINTTTPNDDVDAIEENQKKGLKKLDDILNKKIKVSKQKIFVIINSNKGGSGKSFLAIALGHKLRIDWKVSSAFFDADGSVGSFALAFSKRDKDGKIIAGVVPEESVTFYDIRQKNDEDEKLGRGAFINSLASDADVILHDMAGGSLHELKSILDEDGTDMDAIIDTIKSYGRKIVVCNVIDAGKASTASVADSIRAFGHHAEYVTVLNCREGSKESDFPYWFGFKPSSSNEITGGKVRKLSIEEFNAVELRLPALNASTRAKLEAEQISYSNYQESPILTIQEKGQVNQFLKKFNESLESSGAEDILGHQFTDEVVG